MAVSARWGARKPASDTAPVARRSQPGTGLLEVDWSGRREKAPLVPNAKSSSYTASKPAYGERPASVLMPSFELAPVRPHLRSTELGVRSLHHRLRAARGRRIVPGPYGPEMCRCRVLRCPTDSRIVLANTKSTSLVSFGDPLEP